MPIFGGVKRKKSIHLRNQETRVMKSRGGENGGKNSLPFRLSEEEKTLGGGGETPLRMTQGGGTKSKESKELSRRRVGRDPASEKGPTLHLEQKEVRKKEKKG